jgi:hypothetical protein
MVPRARSTRACLGRPALRKVRSEMARNVCNADTHWTVQWVKPLILSVWEKSVNPPANQLPALRLSLAAPVVLNKSISGFDGT